MKRFCCLLWHADKNEDRYWRYLTTILRIPSLPVVKRAYGCSPSSCAWRTPGGSSGLVVSCLSLNGIVQFANCSLINSINSHSCQLCYACTWLYPALFNEKASPETWTCIYKMRKSVSPYFYTIIVYCNKTVKWGDFLFTVKRSENTKYVSQNYILKLTCDHKTNMWSLPT